MGKTIGLISIKGGVGKTTLSAALASDLAQNFGKKVLLIDANYSAPNLGLHMNIISPRKSIHDVLAGGEKIRDAIHTQYGVDIIPGNFLFRREYNPLKLKNKLGRIKQDYDFVILDSSPNMNEELLSTMLASDSLLLVSTADYPTLSCSMKVARLAKQRGRAIDGMVLNRVREKYEIGLEEIQESTGIPVIARVKDDEVVQLSLHERVPATLFAKDNKFSKEISKISNALVGKKEKRNFLKWVLGFNMKKEEVNREVFRENFYKSLFSG